ncbi:MAG: hypothetical protein KAS93_03145 [Gammaproteobacteria bacterium]|nr:hypothetical protein [Gammaproteobacteria bacterium]
MSFKNVTLGFVVLLFSAAIFAQGACPSGCYLKGKDLVNKRGSLCLCKDPTTNAPWYFTTAYATASSLANVGKYLPSCVSQVQPIMKTQYDVDCTETKPCPVNWVMDQASKYKDCAVCN